MSDGCDKPDSGPSGPPTSMLALQVTLGSVVLFGVAVAAVIFVHSPPARAAGTPSEGGGELFAQHCASCHQATGLGIEGTFPPLAGNPAAADAQYVETVTREGLSGPLDVLGVQYDEVMPPAAALTDSAEITELVQYVVALASTGPADQTDDSAGNSGGDDQSSESEAGDGAAGSVVGDVDRGHDLFIGAARFENGGGSCVACHTAGSVGNLGGWSLGPDLTDVYQSLGGEAGLTGWLANPPSPTMQPIFAERQLSEAELADLVAFLGEAASQDKADTGFDRLSAAGIVGVAILLAGMALTWRGMRQTYVESLRNGGRARVTTGSGRSLAGTRPVVRAERSPR